MISDWEADRLDLRRTSFSDRDFKYSGSEGVKRNSGSTAVLDGEKHSSLPVERFRLLMLSVRRDGDRFYCRKRWWGGVLGFEFRCIRIFIYSNIRLGEQYEMRCLQRGFKGNGIGSIIYCWRIGVQRIVLIYKGNYI